MKSGILMFIALFTKPVSLWTIQATPALSSRARNIHINASVRNRVDSAATGRTPSLSGEAYLPGGYW